MMIESLVSMVRYLSAREDDDLADRMNYLYTPNLLLVFSVLISFKQFGGSPIECLFPNKFPSSWEQYAEMYCWSEDTYFLPPQTHVATIEESERYSSDRRMSYYQWVPFFLLLQAACFRFPSILWKCLSLSSGIRIQDIVKRAMDSKNMEEDIKERSVDVLAVYLARVLRFQHTILRRNVFVQKAMRACKITYSACFISYFYLFIKLIYIGNILIQIYAMNRFLETDKSSWYGFSVVNDIIQGVPWQRSGYFPRESLCDFSVRQVGNIQKYTVQCVMVINILNEKIFLFLWFWCAILLISTVISLFYWIVIIAVPCMARSYINRTLELYENESFKIPPRHEEIKMFVNECLRQDGIFIVRMIGLHAGMIFNSELVMKLFIVCTKLMDTTSLDSNTENGTRRLIKNQLLEYNEEKQNKNKRVSLSIGKVEDLSTPLIPETESLAISLPHPILLRE